MVGTWGRLAPREDSRALASVLDTAMSEPAWRREAGARARQEMERYRLDVVLDAWEALIARVLQ